MRKLSMSQFLSMEDYMKEVAKKGLYTSAAERELYKKNGIQCPSTGEIKIALVELCEDIDTLEAEVTRLKEENENLKGAIKSYNREFENRNFVPGDSCDCCENNAANLQELTSELGEK